MRARVLFFNFGDTHRARIFVKRLALNLGDLAILIDDASVRVIDGADADQSQEIFRLAMMSGGTQI